ncbi:hypothetical protein ACLX1H_009262 [Fusarium chlamydosporum]
MPSKRLANYIERLTPLNQRPSKPSDRPFNNATAKNPPLLRPHGVNRILLYPGSFNPPHQGHLDLLKRVFENAGVDLNIIAAIIVITDDERLTLKMETRDNAVVIPKDKRVKLWRGDGIPVDWAWVYDGSEANWARLRARLTKEVQKDHMELKFIVLNGPDGVTADRGFNPESWNCADSITSDISRPVDFRYPSTLRQLAGCSPWERLKIDRTRLEQQIRAKLRGQQTSVVEEVLAKAFKNLSIIWICRQQRAKPKGIIRFLPYDLEKQSSDAPSSTKIRSIIERSSPDKLAENLRGIALHPKLLVEYLKELPKPVKRVVLPEEKYDQKMPDDS